MFQVGGRANAKTVRRKLAQRDQGAVRKPVWVEHTKQRVKGQKRRSRERGEARACRVF